MALCSKAQHRRFMLHFMVDNSKFDFFAHFCIIIVNSRHIKVGRHLFYISYKIEITGFSSSV